MKKIILLFCSLFMSVYLFASGKKDVLEDEIVKHNGKTTESNTAQYEYDKNGNCIKTEFFDEAGKLVHEIIENSYYVYKDFDSWTYEDENRLYNLNLTKEYIPSSYSISVYTKENDVQEDVDALDRYALLDLSNYLNRKINEEGLDKNDIFVRRTMKRVGVDKIEIFYEHEKFVHLICCYEVVRVLDFLENGKIQQKVLLPAEIKSEALLKNGKMVHEKYYYYKPGFCTNFSGNAEVIYEINHTPNGLLIEKFHNNTKDKDESF